MSERLLFVNACVRGESSRTYRLCKKFMQKMKSGYSDLQTTELDLYKCNLQPLNKQKLIQRDLCSANLRFNSPDYIYAKLFAQADYILIGAPYWDLSFPSVLKIFTENVTVNGITFFYDDTGSAHSLCHAKDLIYITSAGGYIGDCNCGYDYICALNKLYQIKETHFISCEGLDLWNSEVEQLMAQAEIKAEKCADEILQNRKG